MRISLMFWTVFCFGLAFMAGANAHALAVKDVRFGQHPHKIRMVLDINNVVDFRVFTLSSPYRIVIDLPTFSWKAGRVEKPAQAMIRDIRQGQLMPNISRIVFDLEKPAIIQSAFLLPQQGGGDARLVIDYKTVSPQAFEVHQGSMHGTLKVEDYKNTAVPHSKTTSLVQSNLVPKKPLIIIDPGHGGTDPGSIGRYNIYEKKVVLALAKELKKQLQASGQYRVLLTRETDIFIPLKKRVKFARDHDGDLFISLHANSIHKPSVRGASIYTLSKKASDAQTAKLAEKENQSDLIAGVAFNVEDEQVAFILSDFLMNDTMNQSSFLANSLVSKFRSNNIQMLQTPHRSAGFAVLKAPDIPSILVEAGFVTNKKEARLLSKAAHRKKIAKAIYAGIHTYFNYVDKNETH